MDSLPPLTLALISAFVYGVSHIFARLSLEDLHPVAVACLFTLVNLAVAAPIGFATVPLGAYCWQGLISFALMGLVGYAGLRVLFALGIRLLGVSRHAPVAGIYPLFATIGALLLFGEQPALSVWGGTGLIVGGIIWLAHGPDGETWKRKHLVLPLLQAIVRTIGALFRKLGLLYMNTPMLAIAIGGISGGACLLAYAWVCRVDKSMRQYSLNGLFFGIMLGLTNTLAQYLYTLALSRADISLVIPIISTAPLFTILLTMIFLRRIERVGREALYGGILVVLGTIIITLTQQR